MSPHPVSFHRQQEVSDVETSGRSFFLLPAIGISRKSAIRLGLFLLIISLIKTQVMAALTNSAHQFSRAESDIRSLTETVKLPSGLLLVP